MMKNTIKVVKMNIKLGIKICLQENPFYSDTSISLHPDLVSIKLEQFCRRDTVYKMRSNVFIRQPYLIIDSIIFRASA
jgi:hypothetical protein